MLTNDDSPTNLKTRRGHRPCDMCRRKKRRCDGGHPCGHCIQHEFNCTYEQRATQRASANRHKVSLETRLEKVESLLRASSTNIVASIGSSHHPDTILRKGPGVLELVTEAIRVLNKPPPPPHSDDLGFTDIADSFESLSLNNSADHGFRGKSSQAMLVKAAVDLKTGSKTLNPSRGSVAAKPWNIRPWVDVYPLRTYEFPEDDLMISLMSLYFDNVNIFFPILHRPTFEKALVNNTYLRDDGFAGTLLLVCALGAWYSEDPRVHLSAVTNSTCGTAGWKWFDQVDLAANSLRGQPTLYDLQSYCARLAIQFLDRTAGSRACWTPVGIGIRLGVDIGAHRSKSRGEMLTPEEELEKRVYWALILLDSQISGALGRTNAIQAHDFDLEMPIVCDDEHWESSTSNRPFYQPSGTPSLVEFFLCHINLYRILAFTQKILYRSNHLAVRLGRNDDAWEEKIVMELDSALNTWFDSVPAHLRWDPVCPNDVFFDQSAALFCGYSLVRILIHRPFIPAIRGSNSPNNSPSLTICNNAARACTHVAEIHQHRRPNNPLIFGQTALFTAGIVLLLNIWGHSRVGRAEDADLADVHRCIAVLRAQSERWPSTGPLVETLERLLEVDHPLTGKPTREDYEPPLFVSEVSQTTAQPAVSTTNNMSHPLKPPSTGPWTVVPPGTTNDAAWVNHTGYSGEASAHTSQFLATNDSAETAYFCAPHGLNPDNLKYFGASGEAHVADTVAMWSTAPTGFEVSDWDLYLSNIGDMMQTEFTVAT
ncbi:fungal-specific transcription factor domain-containing protein [Mycena maculata]|uniref:Fungal-specific transcription factor domain-containing protein n=1 Tax=Mycena maculata TaxID=230809 RepID=A0AAD7IMZ0_9AGAR|nr:fungal-specific transcription factor domain-containing protein [Mycena maculata]